MKFEEFEKDEDFPRKINVEIMPPASRELICLHISNQDSGFSIFIDEEINFYYTDEDGTSYKREIKDNKIMEKIAELTVEFLTRWEEKKSD